MGIAQHARIGSSAGEIFIHKIVDDIIAKFFPDIHDEMMEAFFDGDLPGIIYAVQAATAGFLFVPSAGGVVPGFHGDPDDLIALILEEHSGDRGIDPP